MIEFIDFALSCTTFPEKRFLVSNDILIQISEITNHRSFQRTFVWRLFKQLLWRGLIFDDHVSMLTLNSVWSQFIVDGTNVLARGKLFIFSGGRIIKVATNFKSYWKHQEGLVLSRSVNFGGGFMKIVRNLSFY